MSRVVTHDVPPALPGTCVVCGIGGGVDAKRKFIDFNAYIEFHGAVYFCSECITPVAESIGYIPVAELEVIKELATGYKTNIESIENENKVLKDALVAILSNSNFESSNYDDPVSFVEAVQSYARNLSKTDSTESDSD